MAGQSGGNPIRPEALEGIDTNALFGNNPTDIFGQGGENGLAAMLERGGVGEEGLGNLQGLLNQGRSGGQGQGQGNQMFNPSMAGGFGGNLPGMMGGGQNIDPAMLQGLGLGGGGLGGADPNILSNLQGMSEEDRKAVLAAMHGDDSPSQSDGGGIPNLGGGGIPGLGAGGMGLGAGGMGLGAGGMGLGAGGMGLGAGGMGLGTGGMGLGAGGMGLGAGGMGLGAGGMGLGGTGLQNLGSGGPGQGGRPGTFGGQRLPGNVRPRTRVYPTEAFAQEVQQEVEKAKACKDPYVKGMNTIIVVDTSESMKGDGIVQAKEAIEKLMSELESISMDYGLEENLCIITCGSDTRVAQHLTNDYQLVRQSLAQIRTGGSTPLQLAISLGIGALQRVQAETVGSHILHPRVIVISDGHATNPSNPQGPDSTTEEISQKETPGVINIIQSMITNKCLRFIYIPVGTPDSTFSTFVESMPGAHIVLAGDVHSLAQYHMQQRVVGEAKEKRKEGQVTKETVKSIVQSKYPSLGERDIEAIMVQINEPNSQIEFQAMDPQLQALAELGMPQGLGRGTSGGPPTNPLGGGGIPGVQQGMTGLNLGGGAAGAGGGGAGTPITEEQMADAQRQIRERREEIQRMRERGEWPPKDDSMPFQLPGLMARPDGPEAQAEESEEITQEKINELLEKYGGGPPKKDNLPIPLHPGIRVTTGPDWMWRMNEVEVGEKGTVVESKPDEENPTGEFDGWIRVKWDNGVEEDYRYGLDYEFDIEPEIGGMDAVEWPPGKQRIIVEEDPLLNDDEDFLETMNKLINKGKPAETNNASSPAGASGVDPFNSELRNPSAQGPPPKAEDIPFLNPAHAKEYERLMQNPRPDPTLPYLSENQLPNQFDGPQFPPYNPETFPGNFEQFQNPPIPDQTGSNVTPSTNQNTAGATSKKPSDKEVCYVWQYYTDEGDWRSYPPDIQKKAETEYLKRQQKGSIVINMGSGSERIIFKSMEQRCVEKRKIRPVRRIEADAEKLRELQEMWSST
ncbi:uncharacterized protein LOC133176091 [Saccostrea echinata]|uniref:uncharacterized protein LOC133176091 n=1 Tax=Saccostrea echinata TaxID=191078 RepID=UPI002A7EC6A9|nr:uncharacterized protein LOC133176091 [Saccostrea echinata]